MKVSRRKGNLMAAKRRLSFRPGEFCLPRLVELTQHFSIKRSGINLAARTVFVQANGPGSFRGRSPSVPFSSALSYGNGLLLMARLVFSHLVVPLTFELVLVNTIFHETSAVAVTLTAVLVVSLVAGEDAFVSVNVGSVYRVVPVQSRPEWRVNTTEPFRAVPPVDVIVAESLGSQFCADVAEVMSVTTTDSLLAPQSPVLPRVFGESPV